MDESGTVLEPSLAVEMLISIQGLGVSRAKARLDLAAGETITKLEDMTLKVRLLAIQKPPHTQKLCTVRGLNAMVLCITTYRAAKQD